MYSTKILNYSTLMLEDVIFFSTLILSITLGCFYKKIEDVDMKRNYGAGLGLIITILVCGSQMISLCLMVWGNIVMIKCCDRRHIHQISLCFTWLHLLYMHIYHVNQSYTIWLNQIISLRMVGLAFEIYGAEHSCHMANTVLQSARDLDFDEPSVHDIVSYAFFFIGIHKGPYFKWKIFNDHLNGSFGSLGDCRTITEQKLKKTCLCLIGYLLLRTRYSPKIYYNDSFYTSYDMEARYIYNIPLLMMYFLQNQIIMLLATCACTEAGFGVYPAECNPLPGNGPSTKFSLLKLVDFPDEALDKEYNFATLKCFEFDRLLIGPRMKDTMRSWYMPTRYWFWAYIYRNLMKADKQVRGACSYIAWTLYSGPSVQQLFISSTLWVYINLESEYCDLFYNNTTMKAPWNSGFSMMRMFCLIYLTPCFIVGDAAVLLRYYNSMFWVYHAILLALMVGVVIIHKNRCFTPFLNIFSSI